MGKRRQRTAEHVVGDVGVKYVELMAATAGCTTLSIPGGADYGFDVPLMTFDDDGKPDNGYVFLQVKSSERNPRSRAGGITVRIKRKHIENWLNEPMPVIVIRYVHRSRKAYWCYVQRELEREKEIAPLRGQTLTLHFRENQVLEPESFSMFRAFKQSIIRQLKGRISHA